MNIDTSTSATVSTNTQVNSNSSTQNNPKANEKAFSEELEKASETKEIAEQQEVQAEESNSTNMDNETEHNEQQSSQHQTQNFIGNLQNSENKIEQLSISKTDILTQNIQALVNTKAQIETQTLKNTVPTNLDYQTVEMSDDDALFFANLVENTDMTMKTIASQIQNEITTNVQGIEQKAKVSATLMNLISDGMKTNQPFRIDFDKDISVILRIDKDGSVSANFIPGDKAVEQYLRNNIGFLKQRFDEENLAYKDLSYSQSKNQNRERNQKQNKENK